MLKNWYQKCSSSTKCPSRGAAFGCDSSGDLPSMLCSAPHCSLYHGDTKPGQRGEIRWSGRHLFSVILKASKALWFSGTISSLGSETQDSWRGWACWPPELAPSGQGWEGATHVTWAPYAAGICSRVSRTQTQCIPHMRVPFSFFRQKHCWDGIFLAPVRRTGNAAWTCYFGSNVHPNGWGHVLWRQQNRVWVWILHL